MRLLAALLVCQAAGIAGSLFTTSSLDTWYRGLVHPSFTPPDWLFGPVWTALYLLMGYALFLVMERAERDKAARIAAGLFLAHLLVNAAWPMAFFVLRMLDVAMVVIVALLGFIVILVRRFWHIDRRAAYLLLPYLAWVTFATALNFAFWQLNP